MRFERLLEETPLMHLTEEECEFIVNFAEKHQRTNATTIYYLRNAYYIAHERLLAVQNGPDTNLKKLLQYFGKQKDDIVLISKFLTKMGVERLTDYAKFKNQ